MAEANPELRAQLEQLDHELEDGDITEKGYQKRRTLLLSQFSGSTGLDNGQKALRVHSVDDSTASLSNGSRSASLAALNANATRGSAPSFSFPESQSPGGANVPRRVDSARTDAGAVSGTDYDSRPEYMRQASQDLDRRYHEPQSAAVKARPQGPSYHRDSLFLPGSDKPSTGSSQGISREPTMTTDYAFNPATQGSYGERDSEGYGREYAEHSRQSTLLDSQQNYFLDFAGQQGQDQKQRDSYGGGPHRYSNSEAFSPAAIAVPPLLNPSDLPPLGVANPQLPLEPRDVPFAVYDSHNQNIPMSRFDNLPSVLRHRGRTNAKRPAYWVLDPKGKEIASITWDKLASRAEKVAQVIRDKSNLYRGDRVALIYRDTEIIEFAVALMGCFIAGVVAVPINEQEDYQKLNVILTSTQAHLALTTDNNLKAFQRDITMQKLTWPRGVEWWKTNDFHPKKREDVPPLSVPDLAYIEFSRAPTGDLRGVVLSHRTIMHQMACLSAIIATVPTSQSARDTFHAGLRDKNGKLVAGGDAGEILLSYLDPRQGIGMIMGVLLTVYGGHTTVWMESRAVDTPGLYANLITKYRATLMLADYPGLKRAAYNYQTDPLATRNFKKNVEPNFSSVKLCLIDTLTVDSEFHEILADRWLRPMRNPRAREVVAPMLCLPEHGGMVISMRDWLGGEERMGCPLKSNLEGDRQESEDKKQQRTSSGENGYSSLIGSGTTQPKDQTGVNELSEVLLDREALKTNEVVVIAKGEEAKKRSSEPGTVRLGAFGYPIPDATLAVVDPETSLLCTPYVVGEIWVDSPSLSGGFWALPRHTETIFHARTYRFEEGNPTPSIVEPEFLRTGLLGCVIDGRIYVLGLYEDRLRQKVEWVEHDMEVAEYRYFFVQHLIVSIMKNVPKIYDCSAFDTFVNEEPLPIVLLESAEASTNPQSSGGPPRPLDTALLETLSERCMEVLYQEHHLRVYCVMITAPNSLPRVFKNGRREIGNMLCRKEFDNGSLACVHVKFGVERAVLNLPVGVDPVGGIWSRLSSQERHEVLMMQDKQYSGVDHREVVIDDRTSTSLNQFSSLVDLLQWRVARQSDELSYCTVDGRGKEGKGITWKKLDARIAAVAMYLHNKVKVRPGNHVILMYTHSEEFVYAVHACFCLGVVAIPMAPLDQNRLPEDAPALLHMIADFSVRAILVNNDVDHLLKQKPVAQHVKQSASVLKINLPGTYNTTKPPKQSAGCRDLGLTMKPAWVQPEWPVLIWTYWTPDHRRVAVQLGHSTIMGMCKVQKETCQMTSSRPVLGCVRSTTGLGFLHTCLMGVYVGAPTYLVSPLDFAQNPMSLFVMLSRYKIKDTYATSQMLDHAMSMMAGKGFTLHELKNLMISTEGRPRVDVFQKVRLHFAGTGLDRTAINTIYSHVLNPMIATRSYMCIEPIELWLDIKALRRGLVEAVDPESNPSALLIQDSGMVPVSTQIAIVNPESCRLCHVGEYGEIWVQSEASVKSFYGSRDPFDAERFNGRTVDGDPHARYVRTGDLGFLQNVSRPIGPGGAQVDMQILFVLGAIGETIEVNGLSHFPMDIEGTVEKCHRNILPGGCAVFQAGGLVVILVEVMRKAYLASIVPVIVNAILNAHQLVIDIVAFVSKGDFPRSRLGEKQRGKILGSWVTRKMRTIAQFGIRDSENAEAQIREVAGPMPHLSGSVHNGGSVTGSSSLRQAPGSPTTAGAAAPELYQPGYAALPTGISEMPTEYDDSIGEPHGMYDELHGTAATAATDDNTPTDIHNHHFELPDSNFASSSSPLAQAVPLGTLEYYDPNDIGQDDRSAETAREAREEGFDHGSLLLVTSSPPPAAATPLPANPTSSSSSSLLPSTRARESFREGDLWTLPSQQQLPSGGEHVLTATTAGGAAAVGGGGGGGLRAININSDDDQDEDHDAEGRKEKQKKQKKKWPSEAIMHMNLSSSPSSAAAAANHERIVGGGLGYGHAR